jgi:hypothetical protein
MHATLEKIGKQLSLDDWLDRAVRKLRFERERNAALQGALGDLDIDLLDPTSEEVAAK